MKDKNILFLSNIKDKIVFLINYKIDNRTVFSQCKLYCARMILQASAFSTSPNNSSLYYTSTNILFCYFCLKKSGLCGSRAFPPMGGHYAKRALRSKCVYSINILSNIPFVGTRATSCVSGINHAPIAARTCSLVLTRNRREHEFCSF